MVSREVGLRVCDFCFFGGEGEPGGAGGGLVFEGVAGVPENLNPKP